MPSKPAKYGMKSWVVCDARSSYAWKMQVYTRKKPTTATTATTGGGGGRGGVGGLEKNQGMRVVLDLTEGLGRGSQRHV